MTSCVITATFSTIAIVLVFGPIQMSRGQVSTKLSIILAWFLFGWFLFCDWLLI